jgi:hypothetical protein
MELRPFQTPGPVITIAELFLIALESLRADNERPGWCAGARWVSALPTMESVRVPQTVRLLYFDAFGGESTIAAEASPNQRLRSALPTPRNKTHHRRLSQTVHQYTKSPGVG